MFVRNNRNEAVINLNNIISIYMTKDVVQAQIMFVSASDKDVYWRFDSIEEATEVFKKLIHKLNTELI